MRRESGRVADVVEMMMRPDYGVNVVASDVQPRSIGVEDLGDVFSRTDCCCCLHKLDGAWCIVLPVTADAKVEQSMPTAMGYKEAVDRSVARINALDLWAPEYLRIDSQSCSTGLHEPAIFLSSDVGLHLSITLTVTVHSEEGILRSGAGSGKASAS